MHKLFVGSLVLVLCFLWWSTHSVGEQPPTPQGELRIVDKSPLNWVWISLNVFEHLIELDKDGKLVPRLATGWQWLNERILEVTLRQGVKFHNGEAFDAEIVKLNWEKEYPATTAPRHWGVHEFQSRVTTGDRGAVHSPVYLP